MTTLAIDLGKYKSVACLYEPASQSSQFETLSTSPAEIRSLLQRISPQQVVIEACAWAGWIYDLCLEFDIPLTVACTNGEAWQWKNVKRKTDRDDALKLARLWVMGELIAVHMPSKQNREYRSLVKYRKSLVSRITRVQNTIRAVLEQRGYRAPTGHRAWTQKGIDKISQYRRPLDECDMGELWRGEIDLELRHLEQLEVQLEKVEHKLKQIARQEERVKLLETMPGMGRKTAEIIVTSLDDPHRFENGRAVSAYAGLVPKQYESGMMSRQGRITGRGPGILRAAVVEVAWVMLRYNPWAAEVYKRICKGQKTRKKQAIVALARKILVRSWAMLRDKQPWDANKGKKATIKNA